MQYLIFLNSLQNLEKDLQIKLEVLIFLMEDPVGFEPTIRELQSHALPLGYRSICLFRIYNSTL